MSDESTVLINLREISETGTTWIEQGSASNGGREDPKENELRQEEGGIL